MPTSPTPWTSRVWTEFHAGNLTRAARDVLLTLRTYRGYGGLICPGHAALADRADGPPARSGGHYRPRVTSVWSGDGPSDGSGPRGAV